jgi:hypothetical protein
MIFSEIESCPQREVNPRYLHGDARSHEDTVHFDSIKSTTRDRQREGEGSGSTPSTWLLETLLESSLFRLSLILRTLTHQSSRSSSTMKPPNDSVSDGSIFGSESEIGIVMTCLRFMVLDRN